MRKSYISDIERSIVFSIWSTHFVKKCLVARFFKLLEKSLDPLESYFDHNLLRSNYSMNSNVFITLLQEALRGSKAHAFDPFRLTLNYTPYQSLKVYKNHHVHPSTRPSVCMSVCLCKRVWHLSLLWRNFGYSYITHRLLMTGNFVIILI